MARPAKAVNVQSGNLTSAEKEARGFVEAAIKGETVRLEPPEYLTEQQRLIFRHIVMHLEGSGILGALDIYILTTCAIAINRLEQIERTVNQNIKMLSDKELLSAKDKYAKDLYRCCNELCLSPQSRAKIGAMAAAAMKQKEDPLLKALAEEDD